MSTIVVAPGLQHPFASQSRSNLEAVMQDQADAVDNASSSDNSEEKDFFQSITDQKCSLASDDDDDFGMRVKSKKAKRKSMAQVMSDDDDDDEDGDVKALVNERLLNSQKEETQSAKSDGKDSSSGSNDNLSERGEVERKVLKRKRKVVVSNDDSDDNEDNGGDGDDSGKVKVVGSATRSRRHVKERRGQSSMKGNAIKRLVKERKRRRGEKVVDSEEDSECENESESVLLSSGRVKSGRSSKDEEKREGGDNDEMGGKFAGDEDVDMDIDKELMEDSDDLSSSGENENGDDREGEVVKRKSYSTRKYTAACLSDNEEIDREEVQKQSETMAILGNTDLFDAEGSGSDEDGRRSSDGGEQDNDGGVKETTKNRRKKIDRPKKMKKAEKIAMESEQQRLFRNSNINIPHHEPQVVSIQQFLSRVPKLELLKKKPKKEREMKDSPVVENSQEMLQLQSQQATGRLSLNNLPKLKKTSDEIVLDVEQPKKKQSMAAPSGLDVFMQRLKKHTGTPKQKIPAASMKQSEVMKVEASQEQNTPNANKKGIIDKEKIAIASETPGSGHMELKKQLQKEMRARREVSRKEAEIRRKLENEEISDEEEEEEFEEDNESENEDDNSEHDASGNELDNEGEDEVQMKNDPGSSDNDEEDDEELKKWNMEDQRKQIETQLDGLDEIDKEYEDVMRRERQLSKTQSAKEYTSFDENTTTSARTVGSSLDLFPGVRNEDDSDTQSSLNLELKESAEWDESNTIPPGQGDSFRAPNRIDSNTPFSKLLKGGLLRSRRESSTSDENSGTKLNSLSDDSNTMLHVQDSQQSLLKDDSSLSHAETPRRSVAAISDDLHFTLDENTQFSQILDTQGYFSEGRKEKKKSQLSSLFDADNDSSVSQLLGLCSGNFENNRTITKARPSPMNDNNFGLPSDLPCDGKDAGMGELDSQEFLGLCSGKFTATQAACDDVDSPELVVANPPPSSKVLELFKKNEDETSESQLMGLCSGNFTTPVATTTNSTLSHSVFEDSKSTGSLMKHFKSSSSNANQLPCVNSFDNLFGGQEKNEKGASGFDRDYDDDVPRQSYNAQGKKNCDSPREKIFFIGSGNEKQDGSSQGENSAGQLEDDEESLQGRRLDEDGVGEDPRKEEDKSKDGFDEEDDVSEEGDEKEGVEDCDEDDDKMEEHENDLEDPREDNEEDQDDESANEDVDEEDEEVGVDEELQEYYQSLPKKKYSKKLFYEHEAQLSGSDVSDDEDFGSEADEYEIDSDVEELPSRSKLHAQVHKAHMKATLEDDKQDIRFIQERFYEDGDLLSDGNGRKRNFRWRNIDKPSQNVGDWNDSEGEAEEEQAELAPQQEASKRIERLEREAFLEQQRTSQEELALDENSQSILNIIKGHDSQPAIDDSLSTTNSQPHPCNLKRMGSFLERSKRTLSRLSSITSNSKKPNAPTRSFVFQAKSMNDDTETTKTTKKSRNFSESETPAAKKPNFGDPRNAFLVIFPICYGLSSRTGIACLWIAALTEWINAILKW
eukprot:gene20500-22517_t